MTSFHLIDYNEVQEGTEDDDSMSKELAQTRSEVQKILTSNLERDIAEIKNDINFLEDQVKYDLGSYTPEALGRAKARIELTKRKAEIMMEEYEKREK